MKWKLLLFLATNLSLANARECDCGDKIIASCQFAGKTQRTAAFCMSEKRNDIYYLFKKDGVEQLKIKFSESEKLRRWVDKWTYTTYFGFSQGEYGYILGVPEEKPGAVAFLKIKKWGDTMSTKNCDANSFGKKDVKSEMIEDVPDAEVRNNGFKFP